MFGLGMTELLVIFVVALLFLGPEKLPDAAKKLSQGLREFREHGRELQRTLDEDTELGSAVRELKSALRGDDLRAAVTSYQPAEESVARTPPEPEEDGEPVERETTRRGNKPASGDDTAPDPYDLRGAAVRKAAAAEAAAKSKAGRSAEEPPTNQRIADTGNSSEESERAEQPPAKPHA